MKNQNDQTPEQKLQEREHLCLLFDFYGPLLKEHPRQMFEDYMLNDYSLSEIADVTGITRQGVHDAVKRASRQLVEFEEKLGLVARFARQQELLHKVRQQLLLLSQREDDHETDPIGRYDNNDLSAWQILMKELDDME